MMTSELSCLSKLLFIIACSSFAESADDNFFLSELESEIRLEMLLTRAKSEVTEWNVLVSSSSFTLGVDSFVPVEENGFWIVGFKSRSSQDIFDMISRLGQMRMIEGEEKNGYCSNLPYFYNYTIDDLLKSHALYAEDGSGNSRSIFDWRSRPPYNPIQGVDGFSYNKSSLKSMTATLKDLTSCLDTTEQYENGTFTFKKTLFHTYVRVKESCVKKFVFHVDQCVDVFQRATNIFWKLITHVIISESVVSTAAVTVIEQHQVNAESQKTEIFHYQSEKGTVLVQSDIVLNINFANKNDNEYLFYLPGSFNLSGFQEPGEEEYWQLVGSPTINLNPILKHLGIISEEFPPHRNNSGPNADFEEPDFSSSSNSSDLGSGFGQDGFDIDDSDWETSNKTDASQNTTKIISSEFYSQYLSDRDFPLSLLPREAMGDNAQFTFKVVSELDESRERFTVSKDFVSVFCPNTTLEPMCRFSRGLTNIKSEVKIDVESKTQVFSTETQLEWKINLLSVSSLNKDNVSPLAGSHRPLYALESLVVDFSISPKIVLLDYNVVLFFITLSLLLPTTSTHPSHLIYSNPEFESEIQTAFPQILFEDRQHDSFGKFDCSTRGVCRLLLKSHVFARSHSGVYLLSITLRLTARSRTKRDFQEQYDHEIYKTNDGRVVPTESLDLFISYKDGPFEDLLAKKSSATTKLWTHALIVNGFLFLYGIL